MKTAPSLGFHWADHSVDDNASVVRLRRRDAYGLTGKMLSVLLALIAMEAIFATVALNLAYAEFPTTIQYLGGAAACLAAALFAPLAAARMSMIDGCLTELRSVKPASWLAGFAVTGCALRIAWDFVYPGVPVSDSNIYLILARHIYNGEAYEIAGTSAYWPPGYPLYLTGVFLIFGDSARGILASNLVLYVASIFVAYKLALRLFGVSSASLAVAVLTLWPNHIMMAGQAMKEYLLLPLLLLTVHFWVIANESNGSLVHVAAAGAGILFGLMVLVQPSMNLLAVPLLVLLLWAKPTMHALTAAAVFCIAMAVPLTPWVVRNYLVFDALVPLTTSGGSNLYRANNELATGGYTDFGKRSLEGFDELTTNDKGFEYAKEWISQNPSAFARLALVKQMRFLGDDSVGAYGSMKWGPARVVPQWHYAAAKVVSNAYWMGIWFTILVSVLVTLARKTAFASHWLLVATPLLYLYGIHSVFESDGKYHFPVIGLIAILAVSALASDQTSSERPFASEPSRRGSGGDIPAVGDKRPKPA